MMAASHFRNPVLSRVAQAAAIPRLIQTNGKACSPDVRKNNDAAIAKLTDAIPNNPGVITAEDTEIFLPSAFSAVTSSFRESSKLKASAAQSARITCRNGSQRKLHRNTLALGSIEIIRTRTSKPSSHFISLTRARPHVASPARRAIGGTNPHAISVAVCGTKCVKKPAHSTVQDGRTKPGSAPSGTSHWKCAELSCPSRAEPCT